MPRGKHAAPSRMAALGAIIVAIVSSQQERPKAESKHTKET